MDAAGWIQAGVLFVGVSVELATFATLVFSRLARHDAELVALRRDLERIVARES